MRLPLLLLALALAGCAAPDAPAEAPDGPPAARTATAVVLLEDVLLGPARTSATFPLEIVGPASSGTFHMEARGAPQGLRLVLPGSCEEASPPTMPPGGSMSLYVGCGPLEAAQEPVVGIHVDSGTLQARVAFAVSYVV